MDERSDRIFNEVPSIRTREYCRLRRQHIIDPSAGSGHDGTLCLTSQQSYLKTFEQLAAYAKEFEAYRRLKARGVVVIQGHNVPQLLDHDDRLGVIEMSTVSRPFVLDFAKVRFDQRLEDYWPADVLAERWTYWESLFEAEQWPTVLAIFHELGRQYGIWLEDLHPGNITFEEGD